MSNKSKKRRSKRLEKKRQWKERRISERLKNQKKYYCTHCNEWHEDEETDLMDVLNVMQDRGQIPKNATFEVNEEDEEGGIFIRDPSSSFNNENYYKYMKETYG